MFRQVPALLLAASLACCSGAPPARPAAGAQPRRVILISLDGGGTLTLHELYRRGLLHGGGFDRFFREGQVADALIPVDPTLTSTNHISLATGFPPAATGIVANQFHAAGSPAAQKANGFDTAIGTETLWEAARRQGRRVGSLAWPGTDAKGERRTADWGMLYNNDPDHEAQVLTLSREDWRPAPPSPGGEALLTSRLTIDGGPEAAARELDLFASEGGSEIQYRAVTGEPSRATPLRVGDWVQVTLPSRAPPRG